MLFRKGSNLDNQNQSLMCYLYTTEQFKTINHLYFVIEERYYYDYVDVYHLYTFLVIFVPLVGFEPTKLLGLNQATLPICP